MGLSVVEKLRKYSRNLEERKVFYQMIVLTYVEDRR